MVAGDSSGGHGLGLECGFEVHDGGLGHDLGAGLAAAVVLPLAQDGDALGARRRVDGAGGDADEAAGAVMARPGG